jgi:hypothetical protein
METRVYQAPKVVTSFQKQDYQPQWADQQAHEPHSTSNSVQTVSPAVQFAVHPSTPGRTLPNPYLKPRTAAT